MKTKKSRENKDYWTFVKACLAITLVGIAVFSLGQSFIGVELVFIGVGMIILSVFFGKEHHFQDERTRRARERAGSNAYFATLVALLSLMAFGKIIPAIEAANYWNVSEFVFFAGFIPFLIYDWYYKRRGDIE
jgi:hypothetical protein